MNNKVRIHVTHGDLSQAQHPVAVGHWEGTTVSSAENYLDTCLNGRLKQRHSLNLYPSAPKTCNVILPSEVGASPAGAIIVGLGKPSCFSSEILTQSLSFAAISYGSTLLENSRCLKAKVEAKKISAPITTLLMGCGVGGLSIESSVFAILKGIHYANITLQKLSSENQVFIDAVEFIEVWEDQAIEIVHSLKRIITDPELQNCFDHGDLLIRTRLGGKVRVSFGSFNGYWDRLQVTGNKNGSLRFNTLTDHARSEIVLIPTQRMLVDQFIKTSINDSSNRLRIGRTLFELLVPNELKEAAPNRNNLVLMLNEESAVYPWEILEDRLSDNGRPLSVESGLIRQLETSQFRSKVLLNSQDKALIIADPISSMPPLKGAQDEGEIVYSIFSKHNYEVEYKTQSKAIEIVQTLHSDSYRILHLSGHGILNEKLPESDQVVSGMVIGDGIFLTPSDVEQMRQIPEIVFINCCYLGQSINNGTSEYVQSKFAANLAIQFIRMGVRAVLAAGWAIDDKAALAFAETFYREMFSGSTFGKAVLNARRYIYENYPNVNTWGAYQCYGDPVYTLFEQPTYEHETKKHNKNTYFCSVSEVVAEINNLSYDAVVASQRQREKISKHLDNLANKIPEPWLSQSNVRAAFGKAYANLNFTLQGIFYLEQALAAENANFTVSMIEDLADLHSKLAIQLWQKSKENADSVKDISKQSIALQHINHAINILTKIQAIETTGKRFYLLSKVYQRKAYITSDQEREEALNEMVKFCVYATELIEQKAEEIDINLIYNIVISKIAISWQTSKSILLNQKTTVDEFQQVKTFLENETSQDNNTSHFYKPNKLLFNYLSKNETLLNLSEIIECYKSVISRNLIHPELDSILENLDFLLVMLPIDRALEEENSIREVLQGVYNYLLETALR